MGPKDFYKWTERRLWKGQIVTDISFIIFDKEIIFGALLTVTDT